MAFSRFFSRCRWLFFREGLLYVLVLLAFLMCVDISKEEESFKIRKLNDVATGVSMSQLYAFSNGEIPGSQVDWDRLSEYLNLTLKFFPFQADAEMFLGYCEYYGLGLKEDAFAHMLHSANNMPYFFWNLYNTGIFAFQKGDMDHAVPYLEMALLLHTDKAFFTVLNSVIYRQLIFGVVLDNKKLLLDMNHAREVAVLLLAAAYYYKQDYGMAEIFAMKGVSDPDVSNREPFYFYAGAVEMAKGNYVQALALFNRAIKEKSGNPLVYLYASDILKKTGHLKEAHKMSLMGQALKRSGGPDEFPYPSYLRLQIF